MYTYITIFKKLVVLNLIAGISIIQFSGCKDANEKEHFDERKDNVNCNSPKFELLLKDLLEKRIIFPRVNFRDENHDIDKISYYLKLINFNVQNKNYYIHLTPSDSNKIDSMKLVFTDSIITKGRMVSVDIFEKNEDTSKVKLLVGFGMNKIASGIGLFSYEFISDSCTWKMTDSTFSWEY